METILAAVGLDKLLWNPLLRDDDIIDRLSHCQTTMLFVVFAVLVSTKQFVGDTIVCWVPAHFTSSQEEYANSYCWIRNTYYLPNDQPVPAVNEDDKRHSIPYYQWLPMILLVQALLFYLPYVAWHTFNRRAGVNINSIINAALTFNQTEMVEVKDKTKQHMIAQLDRYLTKQTDDVGDYKCTISLKHCLSRATCRVCGRRRGNYLVVLYIFVKILYVINVISQLFLLDYVLGSNFHMYGVDVLVAASSGQDWTETPRFPRVTLCDFNIRRFGNIHRYTVQCVLPINQFNEKIYLFIWFWLVAVATLTCFSFVQWFFRFVFPQYRRKYVEQHIGYLETLDDSGKKRCKVFVAEYLKQDGAFIIQLVALNADSITATELLVALWKNFNEKDHSINAKHDSDEHDEHDYHDDDSKPEQQPCCKKICCCC